SVWTTLTDSSLTRRYAGVADVEQREGVARVGVRLRLPDGDSALVVHLRMESAAGHWRVVAVEDLAPYLQASLDPRLERAYEMEMRSALRNLVNAEGMYFADHGTYTPSLGVLTYFNATPDVTLEISAATRDGWQAVARHQKTRAECRIAIGTAVPPRPRERPAIRNLHRPLSRDFRQRPQVRRQHDANHGSVWTSTDSTAGRSRTIGVQPSPPSAEAYTWPPVVPKYTPHGSSVSTHIASRSTFT